MPNVISIDDLDTQHIEYSGNWQVSTDGSSRQWESSTHTTTQPGASATFRFSGYQVWIVATTASGTGSNLIDVSIDGGPVTSISKSSNGDASYDVQYFQSNVLSDSFHQLVVTNRGSSANGHSQPFVFDQFEFVTAANSPTWPTTSDFPPSSSGGSSSSSPGSSTSSPGSSTSSPGSSTLSSGSSTSSGSGLTSPGSGSSSSGSSSPSGLNSSGTTPGTGSTSSQGQVQDGSSSQIQSKESSSTAASSSTTGSKSSTSTTSASSLSNVPFFVSAASSGSTSPSTITATSTVTSIAEASSSSGSKTPVRAIAGGLIGALALIILILSYLLWRRRRQARFNVIDDGEQGPRRSPLAPNPFVLDEVAAAPTPEYLQSHNPFNEKSTYHNQLQPVSTESLTASAQVNATTSDYRGPSTLVSNNAASVINMTSPSSMYIRADTLKSPSVNGDFESVPPPSYTQKDDIAK